MGSVVVSLALLAILGCGTVSSTHLDTRITDYLEDHSEQFLSMMQGHFDRSLEYLFTGNAFQDQSFERPGLAKLLKEQSDRHWQAGLATLQKYTQRGGHTFTGSEGSDNTVETFKKSFDFNGANTLKSDHKGSPDFATTYLAAVKKLVTDSGNAAGNVNSLHKMSSQRRHNHPHYGHYDAEMGHFLEEKMEEEVGLVRKFSVLYEQLAQMIENGMAVYIFDKNL